MEKDNVIPFRARIKKVDAVHQSHNTVTPETVGAHAQKNSAQEQFLSSLKDMGERRRSMALTREAARIGSELQKKHRIFVGAQSVSTDPFERYTVLARIQDAVDMLTIKFGRAAVFNHGGAMIRAQNPGESGWVRRDDEWDSLYLRNDFTPQDIVDLFSPRLTYETEYRDKHGIFDFGHMNG